MKTNDGGPAYPQSQVSDGLGGVKTKACRVCGHDFAPRPWQLQNSDYECLACKRIRQNTLNRNDPDFKAKRRAHNAQPHVKEYNRQYVRSVPKSIRAARRKVATEIEAGRLVRMPCEVCGETNTEAHHEDYTRPLDIRWLCRMHHVEADAMLKAREK